MSLLLNCGSGQRPFQKPWINCDIQPRWNPDVVTDARLMVQFKNESASMIVLHHVLEHLWAEDAKLVIGQCHRILEPGGSLLIFVPDMRELARRWLLKEMDDQLYFTNVYGAFMGDQADIHRWGFNGTTLARMLMDAGSWRHLTNFDWRSITGANIARDWWILGVEAIK